MNCVNSRDKPYKNTVLEWTNDADFTCNEFIVYHEDENVICGRHSFEATDEPKQQVMFFARYEGGKCKFWRVHGSCNSFQSVPRPIKTYANHTSNWMH